MKAIRPPSGELKRAMTTLERGERWALEPRIVDGNPHLWTPGIKYGVNPGSYTHNTEFFGPLLGVMPADDLDHAIELVNMTGFGLTSGIESLDEREQARWKDGIRAGNLYVNRGTTGAITLRQPWPVRRPRPVAERLGAEAPMVTGQRILDSLFPVARGGRAARGSRR